MVLDARLAEGLHIHHDRTVVRRPDELPGPEREVGHACAVLEAESVERPSDLAWTLDGLVELDERADHQLRRFELREREVLVREDDLDLQRAESRLGFDWHAELVH